MQEHEKVPGPVKVHVEPTIAQLSVPKAHLLIGVVQVVPDQPVAQVHTN